MAYASFLLRLWVGENPNEAQPWVFEIESVQTGKRWRFTDIHEALRFLEQQAVQFDHYLQTERRKS